MNHNNDQSAGQGLPSADQEGAETLHKPSMFEEGDIEMEAAAPTIIETDSGPSDHVWTDQMVTEDLKNPPRPW